MKQFWMFFAIMMSQQTVVFADPNVITIYQPKRELFNEAGQPIRLVLSDGREAELKYAPQKPVVIESALTIDENDCTPYYGPVCHYKFGARNINIALVWTKHPNPDLINKVVKVGDRNRVTGAFNNERALGFRTAMFPNSRKNHIPALGADLEPEQLICSDFRWMPNAATHAPKTQTIMRISNEQNVQNPETLLTENRTEFDTFDIELARLGPKSMRILPSTAPSDTLDGIPVFVYPSTSMTFQKEKGKTCLVGASNNIFPLVIQLLFSGQSDDLQMDPQNSKTFNVDESQNFLQDENTVSRINQDILTRWDLDRAGTNSNTFVDYE